MHSDAQIAGLSGAMAGLKPEVVSTMRNLEDSDSTFAELVYTHVVAADGKWSTVRAAAAALERQEGQQSDSAPLQGAQGSPLTWSVEYEQTWGVQMLLEEARSEGQKQELLAGFRRDASHIVYPKTLQGAIYALVMPLQDGSSGGGKAHTSISIVCSDLLLERYPWAAPLEASRQEGGVESWFDDAESQELNDRFARLVAEDFPQVNTYARAHTHAHTHAHE